MADLKKIGIITYYYQSINYGGNLQAYALCKKLNDMGGIAEQICFDAQNSSLKSGSLLKWLKQILRRLKKFFWRSPNAKLNKEIYERRKKAFFNFNSLLTPHSKDVYTQDTIKNCIENYDTFITGSDQVWNPNWYIPAYYLNFVPSKKNKVSYATSFGVSIFTEEQINTIQEHLRDFSLISLRENSILETLDVFPVVPEIMVDPTLLLSKEEWEALCLENTIKDNYIFCYFFGSYKLSRILAREYAKKNNCKVVTIPHLNGYNIADVDFADEEYIDASPEMFITLIRGARCIFTDSFHAVVFSNIFQKEYYVFKRSEKDTMSSRIYSITKLFNSEDRFLHKEEMLSVEYIQSRNPINYNQENIQLEILKEKSNSFLEKILQL